MLSGEAPNTNLIIIGLTRPVQEPTIWCTRGENVMGITRIPRYNLTLKKWCLHEYIFQFYWNKYKITNEKHYTIRPVLKSNKNKNHKTISNIDTSNTHVHDSSFFWLGTGMSVKSGVVKLNFMGPRFPSLSEITEINMSFLVELHVTLYYSYVKRCIPSSIRA